MLRLPPDPSTWRSSLRKHVELTVFNAVNVTFAPESMLNCFLTNSASRVIVWVDKERHSSADATAAAAHATTTMMVSALSGTAFAMTFRCCAGRRRERPFLEAPQHLIVKVELPITALSFPDKV